MDRTIRTLIEAVRSGRPVQAFKVYRALYLRFLAQRKYPELLNMLYIATQVFLQHKQPAEGGQMGILLIDALAEAKNRDFDLWVPRLSKIFRQIKHTPPAEKFLLDALGWTASDTTTAHPLLLQDTPIGHSRERSFRAAPRNHSRRSTSTSASDPVVDEITTLYESLRIETECESMEM